MTHLPREETQGLKRWLSGQGLKAQMAELHLKPRTCHNHLPPFNWEETGSQAKPASVSPVRNARAEGQTSRVKKEEKGPTLLTGTCLSAEKGWGRPRMWLGLSGAPLTSAKHWV